MQLDHAVFAIADDVEKPLGALRHRIDQLGFLWEWFRPVRVRHEVITRLTCVTQPEREADHDRRDTEGNQDQGKPGRHDAGRGGATGGAGPHGVRGNPCGGGVRVHGPDVREGRGRDPVEGEGGLRQVRDGDEGQGAAGEGIPADPQGAGGVHLFSLRGLRGADAGHHHIRLHRRRLRDRQEGQRVAAAADTHERGGRQDGRARRRQVPRKNIRRQGQAARRCAGGGRPARC